MLEVDFYKTSNGKRPVAQYIDSLSPKQAKKVAWVLNLIESMNQVPTDYLTKLKATDDIWEARVQFGSDIFRLLGFIDFGKLILTNGFTKKTQKTPRREIEKQNAEKQTTWQEKENNYE